MTAVQCADPRAVRGTHNMLVGQSPTERTDDQLSFFTSQTDSVFQTTISSVSRV